MEDEEMTGADGPGPEPETIRLQALIDALQAEQTSIDDETLRETYENELIEAEVLQFMAANVNNGLQIIKDSAEDLDKAEELEQKIEDNPTNTAGLEALASAAQKAEEEIAKRAYETPSETPTETPELFKRFFTRSAAAKEKAKDAAAYAASVVNGTATVQTTVLAEIVAVEAEAEAAAAVEAEGVVVKEADTAADPTATAAPRRSVRNIERAKTEQEKAAASAAAQAAEAAAEARVALAITKTVETRIKLGKKDVSGAKSTATAAADQVAKAKDVRLSQVFNPKKFDIDNFNFLQTSTELVAALIGEKTLKAKQQELYDKVFAAAKARKGKFITDKDALDKSARKSADRAKNQQVRNLLVGQGGDECRRIYGISDKPVEGPCYICGINIEDVKVDVSAQKPECEHVFPVAQAIIFQDLYRGGTLSNKDTAMFMKEYKWAHRICNQVKSDDKFIKKAGDEWIADEAAITKYLNDLLGTKTQYGKEQPTLSKRIIGDSKGAGAVTKINNWINERKVAIVGLCKELLTAYNTCPPKQRREYVLGRLQKCAATIAEGIASSTGSPRKTGYTSSDTETPPSPPPSYGKRGMTPARSTGQESSRSRSRSRPAQGNTPNAPRRRGFTSPGMSGQGRGITPVRTLGAFKKGRHRKTRNAKIRNRRTRKNKFSS